MTLRSLKLGCWAVCVVVFCAAEVVVSETQRAGDAFDRSMNLAKAHLENRKSAEAIKVLTEALAIQPTSAAAHRNMARAYRIARKPEKVLASLAEAAKHEPESVATSYLAGLAYSSMSRFPEAAMHLEEAVRLDPTTATLRYQLASAYQAAGEHEKAAEQLGETVRLDPLHASAFFKLANYARQKRDTPAFQKHQREFLRLRKIFGDESRTAGALEFCSYTRPESAPYDRVPAAAGTSPAIEVRFVDATKAMFGAVDAGIAAACVIEVNEAGQPTLLTVGAAGVAMIRPRAAAEVRHIPVKLSLPASLRVTACLVGDFHNDVPEGEKYDARKHALGDVLLLGAGDLRLLKRTGRDTLKDVTKASGLAGVKAKCARWVDYEVDGDVDLVIGHDTGIDLWQNNGNGTFEKVTEKVGIEVSGAVADIAAVDFENNVAMDLVVARGTQTTEVLINQRAGRFLSLPSPPGSWAAAVKVLGGDLNNDGVGDVVLVGESEAVLHLGGIAERPRAAFPGMKVSAARLVDYDNDGWSDLCIAGETATGGAIRLFRNLAGQRWQDVTEAVGLGAIKVGRIIHLLAVDADNDRDTDLLAVVEGEGLRVLANEGGHVNGQVKVRLETLKSNPTGIGVQLEIRDGDFRSAHLVDGVPIEIGLGGRKQLDSLRTLWTNGIVDNQVKVAVPDKPMTLIEKNVAAGSCPLLYAWDGTKYRFVTDLLGNAPIGLSLTRDMLLPADPDEYVEIGRAERFPPRDDAYEVVITDEFREVVYLDYARLVAVDHPADVELHSTDKLMPSPFPASEVWAMTSGKTPRQAVGDDGIDRTDALGKLDGVFSAPGTALPPPYRGMCRPMSMTMDFGPLDASKPWVLALTGWLQYGDASTNIALSQDAGLAVIQPALEVETTAGEWRPIDLTVGLPAGKTKTILCDLAGKLPAGAQRLRLTTSFEVRWDRIALLERVALPERHRHSLLPASAKLAWRGFSEIRSRAPGHPTTPDFDTVFPRPAWDTALQGWCTSYGDVAELMLAHDDRLVVMNAGDALTLRFDASALPPVAPGNVRTFFLYSVGWDKDGDHNIVGGEQVAPMPTSVHEPDPTAEIDETDWQIRHNTRFVPRDRFCPERRAAGTK